MRGHCWVRVLVALACGSGCGASPAAPQAPVGARPAAATAPPPAPLDLSAVADPARMILSGRLGRPGASLGVLHGWSQLPLVQVDQLTELVAGKALGPLVDLDAPIDFAVSVQGEGMRLEGRVAVSAGVADPDAARSVLGEKYTLVPAGNGVLVIRGLGRESPHDDGTDDADDARAGKTCELAPSFGTPSTRLVCADDPKALSELAPWLTRTATRATSAADLGVELRMAPLRPTLTALRQMAAVLVAGLLGGGPVRDDQDALLGLATDVLDFAADLDGASLDVDLADPAADARLTLRFAGASSALTRLALAHPGGAPPPQAFHALAVDADLGFFERGFEPGDLEHATRLAGHLTDGLLSEAGLEETDRKALVGAIAKLPSAAPLGYASGLDATAVEAAELALRAAKGAAASQAASRARTQALLGWRLMEMDEPAARLAGALEGVARAIRRPGVARAFTSKKVVPPALRTQPWPTEVALPAGALHYVLELPPPRAATEEPGRSRKAAAEAALPVHLLLVPDGPRSWLALGGDAAALARRLARAQSGSQAPRTDLGPLDQDPAGAGAFLDVRSLPQTVVQLSTLAGEPSVGALSLLDAVAALPHGGTTPVVALLTARAASSVEARLHVPRGAIEDAVVLGLSRASP